MHKIIFVYLWIAFISYARSWNNDPGFKSTISLDGLSYMKDVGISILKSELSNIPVPSVNGHFHTDQVGTVVYSVNNIKWRTLDVPTSRVEFIPGAGVNLYADGVAANVTLDWSVTTRDWPNLGDSGSCHIAVTAGSINVSVHVDSNKGRPNATVISTFVNVGASNFEFFGPSSWIYNLLMEEISNTVRQELENGLAGEIKSGINHAANQALAGLPTLERIDSHVEIDYDIINAPTVSDNFFTFNHRGEFFRIADPANSPYLPLQIPDNYTNEMVQMFISDYVANSVAFSYFTDDVLKVLVTDSMLPEDAPLRLNTTYFQEMIPPLYEAYPGELMNLNVYANLSPVFNFSTEGAMLHTNANVDVYVEPSNALAFTLNVEVFCGGMAMVSDTQLSGELFFVNASMALTNTTVGEFDPSVIQSAVNSLLQLVIVPMANKKMKKGLILPSVPGLNFVNSSIGWGEGYLFVSTSINYSPPFIH